MLANLQAVLQPPPARQSVKIGDGLKEISLKSLPAACWPSSELTDKVRDECEGAKKKGIARPFTYVDLRHKPLAAWATALPSKPTQKSSGKEGAAGKPKCCFV